MKRLTSLFIVLLILGVVMTFVSAPIALAVLKDDIKNFNEMSNSEFKKNTVVDGELQVVYGLVATETVTNTRYGIKTGSTETNFYLVETKLLDEDGYLPEDSKYILYSTAHKDQIEILDELVKDFENDEELTKTFYISGRVIELEDEIKKYRDDALKSWEYSNDEIAEYSIDMVIRNENFESSKILFFVGIGITVVDLIILILFITKSIKAKNSNEYGISEKDF